MRPTLGLLAAATLAAALAASDRALAAEAWIGGFGHDIKGIGLAKGGMEGGSDIELGYRSDPLDALRIIGRPSAYVFGSVNTAGQTDFASAGLSWRFPLGRRFYLDPGIGLAIHDGNTILPRANAPGLSLAEAERRAYLYRHKIQFGSRVVFEPELAIGYRLSPRWAAEVAYVHLSQAHLFGRINQGMDDLGMRLVYRFGR